MVFAAVALVIGAAILNASQQTWLLVVTANRVLAIKSGGLIGAGRLASIRFADIFNIQSNPTGRRVCGMTSGPWMTIASVGMVGIGAHHDHHGPRRAVSMMLDDVNTMIAFTQAIEHQRQVVASQTPAPVTASSPAAASSSLSSEGVSSSSSTSYGSIPTMVAVSSAPELPLASSGDVMIVVAEPVTIHSN